MTTISLFKYLGSTRSKGSGTSHALSELTRRREEKNKVRSKRHRRDSPSPDRKRRRRYGDQSDYEYSGEDYDNSDEEKEKKVIRKYNQLDFSFVVYQHCYFVGQKKDTTTGRNANCDYYKKYD